MVGFTYIFGSIYRSVKDRKRSVESMSASIVTIHLSWYSWGWIMALGESHIILLVFCLPSVPCPCPSQIVLLTIFQHWHDMWGQSGRLTKKARYGTGSSAEQNKLFTTIELESNKLLVVRIRDWACKLVDGLLCVLKTSNFCTDNTNGSNDGWSLESWGFWLLDWYRMY